MSRVNLNDDPDLIAQKVRKAKTDPEPLPADPKELDTRPEAKNLVTIYAALAESGFFSTELLEKHCADGSVLSGHVSHRLRAPRRGAIDWLRDELAPRATGDFRLGAELPTEPC